MAPNMIIAFFNGVFFLTRGSVGHFTVNFAAPYCRKNQGISLALKSCRQGLEVVRG